MHFWHKGWSRQNKCSTIYLRYLLWPNPKAAFMVLKEREKKKTTKNYSGCSMKLEMFVMNIINSVPKISIITSNHSFFFQLFVRVCWIFGPLSQNTKKQISSKTKHCIQNGLSLSKMFFCTKNVTHRLVIWRALFTSQQHTDVLNTKHYYRLVGLCPLHYVYSLPERNI